MKKSRFTESQMVAFLKEGGSGIPVAEVCRKHGISAPTYYQWKSKYAGMSLPEDWAKRDTPVVEALNEVVEHHGPWASSTIVRFD